MTKIKTLALCAILAGAALSTSAEAQQINVPKSADSGTSAQIARVRAYGNSQVPTWQTTFNTTCSNITIGSTTTAPTSTYPSAGLPAGYSAPNFSTAAPPPSNAAIQSGPLTQVIATGQIINACFAR